MIEIKGKLYIDISCRDLGEIRQLLKTLRKNVLMKNPILDFAILTEK